MIYSTRKKEISLISSYTGNKTSCEKNQDIHKTIMDLEKLGFKLNSEQDFVRSIISEKSSKLKSKKNTKKEIWVIESKSWNECEIINKEIYRHANKNIPIYLISRENSMYIKRRILTQNLDNEIRFSVIRTKSKITLKKQNRKNTDDKKTTLTLSRDNKEIHLSFT